MHRIRRSGLIGLVLLLAVGSILFWGFNRDERNFEISKNLNIYYTLFRELNLFYVDEVDPGDLITKSIDAMLQSLDPYTTYIPESDIEDFKLMTTGEYAGIGALISKYKDDVIITEPYKGFPADKAGIKAGDIIVEVNGISTAQKSASDVSELLKGQPNASITIKIKRFGHNKPLEKKLIRERIQLECVPYYGMVADSIGYIHLNQFTDKAGREVKNALIDLKQQNAKAIILDLRGNPGGLLDQAIEIVNLFVNQGENIVSTKGKVSKWDNAYKATRSPIDSHIPLVVLVSRGSASASEVVAGAIQDLDRGLIIGQRTFGKGLVQTTRNLSYNAKLKVTTAEYYIPSGRCIQAVDYTHRNEDGSVGKIPDSLISEYKTKNGRTVYDGGGILPDVTIESETYSKLAIDLTREFKIFDFATKYAYKHDSILPASEFMISDAEFEAFKQDLKDNKFEFEPESIKLLKELREATEEEKYHENSQEEFAALEAKLTHDLDRDLDNFSDELKDLISREIVKRYYYQKGSIVHALNSDKTLKQTINLLSNPAEYQSLLDGSSLKHAKE